MFFISFFRHDFPTAYLEQQAEEAEATRKKEEYYKCLREQELKDAEMAKRMFRETEEQRKYESARDEIFAKRLQNLEIQHKKAAPNGLNTTVSSSTSGGSSTPPLLMSSDGDIFIPGSEPTFAQGKIDYNDQEYKVKLARPARVKAEPVYANNRPEHYAVSSQYPSGGARRNFDAASVDLACAAGLLSQADIALSQKAEAMLEQEKKDQELAHQLQQEMELEQDTQHKDLEFAIHLQEKEKAKLRRAKERSKAKKQAAVAAALANDPDCIVADPEQRHKRPESQNSVRQQHNTSQNSINHHRHRSLDEESLHPPARRPYVNTAAIDNAPQSDLECPPEPYYANMGPNEHVLKVEITHTRHPSVLDDENIPVPPYMPMQNTASKKSTSMEKKLNKKKEKEGCKQQ